MKKKSSHLNMTEIKDPEKLVGNTRSAQNIKTSKISLHIYSGLDGCFGIR